MNNLPRDLLDESPDFRKQLFQNTLAASRRARRLRTVARVSATCSILILAALLLYPRRAALDVQPVASTTVNPPSESSRSYTVIHTEPFTNVITTTPLAAEYQVASSSHIEIIDPSDHPEITPLTDDQLLALFAGQSVALVQGPRGEELIFLETDPAISN